MPLVKRLENHQIYIHDCGDLVVQTEICRYTEGIPNDKTQVGTFSSLAYRPREKVLCTVTICDHSAPMHRACTFTHLSPLLIIGFVSSQVSAFFSSLDRQCMIYNSVQTVLASCTGAICLRLFMDTCVKGSVSAYVISRRGPLKHEAVASCGHIRVLINVFLLFLP